MADTKISALTALAEGPATGDLLALVDISDTSMAGTGTTKKIARSDLMRSGFTVDGGAIVSNVGTWGRGLEDLRGDQLGYAAVGGNLTPGLWADLRVGTAASPVTGSSGKGAVLKISKTEDLRVADFVNGQTNEQSGALAIHVKGLATQEMQTNCGYVVAESTSTSATSGANRDAMGWAAVGRITGSGTGYGIGMYAVGRRDTNTGKFNGLEVRGWNETATDISYNSAGASDGMGLWLSCSGPSGAGNRKCGSAIQIGRVNSDAQWDVGIGIAQHGSGSPVATTTFRDDCNSTNGIIINGTKTCAIGVAAGAGPVQVGRTAALINAGALLECYTNGTNDNILALQGQNAGDAVGVKLGNGSASNTWFIVGGTDNYLTGTAQGDAGVSFSATKVYHLGRIGSRGTLRLTDNVAIGPNASSFGSGAGGVIFVSNATTAPSANPTGGGVLYAESGALKWRGSGGAITILAEATAGPDYTITNATTDRVLDCNSYLGDELADVVGTLITDLIAKGILS